jgi:hypothetical protein
MHQHHCGAVFQHVVQAWGLFPNTHRDRDGAQPRGREQTQHKLDAVAQQQGNPVPGLHTQCAPSRGQLAHTLVQLRIGQTRVITHQGLSLRATGNRIGQQRMQTARPVGKATQRSGWLEMLLQLLRRPMHLKVSQGTGCHKNRVGSWSDMRMLFRR